MSKNNSQDVKWNMETVTVKVESALLWTASQRLFVSCPQLMLENLLGISVLDNENCMTLITLQLCSTSYQILYVHISNIHCPALGWSALLLHTWVRCLGFVEGLNATAELYQLDQTGPLPMRMRMFQYICPCLDRASLWQR